MKTTKEDILFSSLKLFAERGFEAVSTSMIASEIGITKGALYRHFENKQTIFDEIIQRILTQSCNEDYLHLLLILFYIEAYLVEKSDGIRAF